MVPAIVPIARSVAFSPPGRLIQDSSGGGAMTVGPTNESAAKAAERPPDGSWRSLRDAIHTMLREHGYAVESRRDGLDLRFEAVTGDGRHWRTQILLDDQHAVARLFVYLDLDRAVLPREWLIELVCRVNSLLAIGAFDFDWDTSEVAFRHGRDFTGQSIDSAQVAQLLKVAVVALRLFSRALAYATEGDVSPLGALDAARVAEDLAVNGVSSEAGRRALVRLVK